VTLTESCAVEIPSRSSVSGVDEPPPPAAVFAADALGGLLQRHVELQQRFQVGFDLLFVDTESGGKLLGFVVYVHHQFVRRLLLKTMCAHDGSTWANAGN